MLEQLLERIKNYEQQIEKSAANHNAMVGALQELKNIYEIAKNATPIVEAIAPELKPEIASIEAVIP